MVIVTFTAAVEAVALAGLPMIRNCSGSLCKLLGPVHEVMGFGKELLSVTRSAPAP